MQTHRFSLVTEDTAALGYQALHDQLALAGCGDTELSRPTGGDWVIEFSREADAFQEAVLPAIDCVTQAGVTVSHVVMD